MSSTIERTTTETAAAKDAGAAKSGLMRWLPIALIATGAAAAIYFLGDYLSFQTLADNREDLIAWRDGNYVLAALIFAAVYGLATAVSMPGAIWFTITGGFLFGTILGTGLSVIGATLGASLVFLAAKTSLGETLRSKAGGWLTNMEKGFREGEISFLLIMRLVPVVPFWVANLAPAFLGTRLATFAWTTLIGIIPGAAVYASLGSGVGALIDRGETPDLGVIFSFEVLGPLLGLAALAALPLVLKKLKGKRETA
ncbi:MAG: VTT domain-containing protein [Pseudomonadota bacterium]